MASLHIVRLALLLVISNCASHSYSFILCNCIDFVVLYDLLLLHGLKIELSIFHFADLFTLSFVRVCNFCFLLIAIGIFD